MTFLCFLCIVDTKTSWSDIFITPLSHISVEDWFSPRYKRPCSFVRNAWFILLLCQTSMELTDNTIKAQSVISSEYFGNPRTVGLVIYFLKGGLNPTPSPSPLLPFCHQKYTQLVKSYYSWRCSYSYFLRC